eukprot:TRINITY_DN46976_c0_g1_i1.p1 TRINITY_DN46976_c0_g1~~TRINITY_DN46976_c0_g1_i1.p1  ORF type:complete len:1061 (+),score=216.16 TRINITY_DN46976_c0_g1_i1:167-3184(+)
MDSGGIAGSRLAVLDKYAHVLNEYTDDDLIAITEVATAPEPRPPHERPELLRGSTEDPKIEWITLGFPRLARETGRFYFEVELLKGCSSPQVGLLSSSFKAQPGARSTLGVGDDDQGWAVDGQHAAQFHAGRTNGWDQCWPSSDEGELLQSVVVGVAVDLDDRWLYFSSDGCWSETPNYSSDEIPAGVKLYPAISLKGRASFNFGPDFQHAPPPSAVRWAEAPIGKVRVDCPRIGHSSNFEKYKEVQIHGEVSLKRNVQRLVADKRYRDEDKTERSWALRVSGTGRLDGHYKRVGACGRRPKYKSDAGAVLYFNTDADAWRLVENDGQSQNSEGGQGVDCDHDDWAYSAPAREEDGEEPPRIGWKVRPQAFGKVPADVFGAALAALRAPPSFTHRLLHALSPSPETSLSPESTPLVYRSTGETTLEAEWSSLCDALRCEAHEYAASIALPAAECVWARVLEELDRHLLVSHGLAPGVVVHAKTEDSKTGTWTKRVRLPGADGLQVLFAGPLCAGEETVRLQVFAGGLDVDAVGPGARVELGAYGAWRVRGTLAEELTEPQGAWLVKLDEDGLAPLPALPGARDRRDACFAIWSPNSTRVAVEYGAGEPVGSELARFRFDPEQPLAPLSLAEFVGDGPAQRAGAKCGWFLDLETMFQEARKELPNTAAEALESLQEVQRWLDSLCDARGPDDGSTSLESVRLHLCDSLDGTLLPEVHVTYADPCSVGDEVAAFVLQDNGRIAIQAFATATGPAQAAGARAGWCLDVPSTLRLNPMFAARVEAANAASDSVADANGSAAAVFNAKPEALREMSGTFVFELTDPGACSIFGPSSIKDCRESLIQLPDINSAEVCIEAERTWGQERAVDVFALLLPSDAAQPSRDVLETFAERWRKAHKQAEGLSERDISVERDRWDEERLRALCRRHGWEFEWMTEEGERRRRMNESHAPVTLGQGGAAAASTALGGTLRRLDVPAMAPRMAELPDEFCSLSARGGPPDVAADAGAPA